MGGQRLHKPSSSKGPTLLNRGKKPSKKAKQPGAAPSSRVWAGGGEERRKEKGRDREEDLTWPRVDDRLEVKKNLGALGWQVLGRPLNPKP